MSIIYLSMPQRYKRLLQAMTLAVAIIYTTLVLYQSTYGYPSLQQNTLQHQHYVIDNEITLDKQLNKNDDDYSQKHQNTQLKLLNYAILSTQNEPQIADKEKLLASSTSTSTTTTTTTSTTTVTTVSEQQLHQSQSLVWQQQPLQQQPLQQHQGTTVVIRKDIMNFNFSDIEVSAAPKHAATSLLTEFERRSRNGELLHDLSQRAVTATPKPPITELDDIFISVKTTNNYHKTRLALIINTWFQLARDQTWFFTDSDDRFYAEKTKGHLINTNCSQGHFRKALCCKMSAELDVFLESGKKWFCHFDDDNYVNVPRLVKLLDDYSPTVDYYLGKPSISSPLEIHLDSRNSSTTKKITFWFATGGAGFCLSRALTLKMLPIAGGGKFISIGDKIRFPDDVTMGFIIEHLLKVPLTVVDSFHSHLEPMEFIRPETFHDQVSFSYAHMKNQWNIIKVDGFDLETDPKRFYSLHCHLFPYFNFCPPR